MLFVTADETMNPTLKKQTSLEADRQLTGVRFSPSGDVMMSGGYDGTVRWWKPDDEGWAEQPALTGHHGWVAGPVFSADGQHCFTADSWGELRGWIRDENGWKSNWVVSDAHDGWIRQVAINHAGTQLATCGRDGFLKLWHTTDGQLQHVHEHDAELFSVRYYPDGQSLITGDLYGHVDEWKSASLEHVRTLDVTELFTEHRLQEVGGARQLRFNADGTQLAIAGTRPKNGGNVQGVPLILLFDWKTGERSETLELGATSDVYVTDLEFHPEGYLLATTSGNPGTGQFVAMRPGEEKPFLIEKSLANCHAFSRLSEPNQIAVTSTNKKSNGNGRRLDEDGNYPGNYSIVTLFELRQESSS
jgi:WD40 repeat protein